MARFENIPVLKSYKRKLIKKDGKPFLKDGKRNFAKNIEIYEEGKKPKLRPSEGKYGHPDPRFSNYEPPVPLPSRDNILADMNANKKPIIDTTFKNGTSNSNSGNSSTILGLPEGSSVPLLTEPKPHTQSQTQSQPKNQSVFGTPLTETSNYTPKNEGYTHSLDGMKEMLSAMKNDYNSNFGKKKTINDMISVQHKGNYSKPKYGPRIDAEGAKGGSFNDFITRNYIDPWKDGNYAKAILTCGGTAIGAKVAYDTFIDD